MDNNYTNPTKEELELIKWARSQEGRQFFEQDDFLISEEYRMFMLIRKLKETKRNTESVLASQEHKEDKG